MASNAARKLVPHEHTTGVDHAHVPVERKKHSPEEISRQKEIKRGQIFLEFNAVRGRVKGKDAELNKMREELTDLLNEIPKEDEGDFAVRFKDFADKFRNTIKKLNRMSSEEKLEEMPQESALQTGSASIDKKDISKFFHTDTSGSVLRGEINKTAKGRPVFGGEISMTNNDVYNGLAVLSADGSYVFQGKGVLEKHDGVKQDGFFQNGILLHGYISEDLKDGQTQIHTIDNGNVKKIEVGKFDSKHNLSGVGIREDSVLHIKEQGNFVDGKLMDGFVVDAQSGKQLEQYRGGKKLSSGEMSGNFPSIVQSEEAAQDERLAMNARVIIDRVSGSDALVRFKDINNNILIGSLIHTSDGKHIFSGKIESSSKIYDSSSRSYVEIPSEYHGRAVLDNAGSFNFQDTQGEYIREIFGKKVIEKGDFDDGLFISGTLTEVGKDVRYKNAVKMVAKIEDGHEIERVFDMENYQDDGGVKFKGQLFEKLDKKNFVGDFTTSNGTIYHGEATINKNGEFEMVKGKSTMIKAATVIDKFKKLFARKEKEVGVPALEAQAETTIEPEVIKPSEFVPDVVNTEILEITDKDGDLLKFDGHFDKADANGTRKFDGTIVIDEKSTNSKFEYIGSAKILKDNKYLLHGLGKLVGTVVEEGMWKDDKLIDGEIHDLSGKFIGKIVNGKSESSVPKEKGWMSKTADVVFTKETAKITSQVAYKTTASIYGVKILTDIGLALTAGALNKIGDSKGTPERVKKAVKSKAEAAGSYSDVYKYYVGREQVNEIKKSFAEYMNVQHPASIEQPGSELKIDDESVVEEKYSTLKSKIESANEINPEAKAKLLLRLEKLKQKFEAEREILNESELQEAYKTVEAFTINNTAVMQITRDAWNGLNKAAMVMAIAGTAGTAAPLVLATKFAIARVMGMAATKVIERVQKHKISKEQKKIEGDNNEVSYTKDLIVHAFFETMHGMSANVLSGGKDVKTGKQLDGKARLANFAKSWGNAFVAGGVVLGSLGYTIGEVIGNIFHNADEVKGAGSSVAQETMQRVHEKVVAGGVLPDGAKVAVAGEAVDSASAGVGADSHAVGAVESGSATLDAAPGTASITDSTKFLEEHGKLSDQAKTFFTDLVAKHPGLNKEGTLKAIWDASENKRSSLDITGAKVQTEIFKAIFASEGKDDALAYLKDDAHLHGLALQKLGKGGFEAFVNKFDAAKDNPVALDKLSHQLYGAMKADIDTDLTNKGYIERHADGSVRDVGAGKARHFFGVDKDGKAILDSGKVSRFTHSAPEHAPAKVGLDKVISKDSISTDGLKPEKIILGPNIKAAIPDGWSVSEADEAGVVNGLIDPTDKDHARFLIHNDSENVDDRLRIVDSNTGKIFDLDGHHVGNLENAVVAGSAGGAHSVVENSGSKVAESAVASKGAMVEQGHKEEVKGVQETGEAKKVVEKTAGKEKVAVVKGAVEAPVDEEKAKAVEELPPAVKEITSLKAGREALASMESLEPIEKTRLSNFTYLLQWQQQLYGQDGSSLRNALEGEGDDVFGTIDKSVVDKMMSDLAHNNESARKALMSGIQNDQPYDKIIESMNDKMPGYSMLNAKVNKGFHDNVFGTDLSENAAENQLDFNNLEVNRVKEMIEKAQQDKYLQMRTVRK